MAAFDQTLQEEIQTLLSTESEVHRSNQRHHDAVTELRREFDSISSISTFSTCKTISRISMLQTPGYNPRILLGFSGNCSSANSTPCSCRGMQLQ
ncbi:hypothetical protein FHG87_025724, partial [Trinorchestia longiramus]